LFADDTVSRRHAELRLVEGRWMLRDLGSTNGTWVNGRRVMEAEVAPGDELQLGAVTIRI
jgi:pSer/pThr/pTyr-binding forkhead associated (FHA) protein